MAMATSGIAGTLLPGGSTVHSKVKVPIEVTDESECWYKDSSGTADMIKRAKLMVIDEITRGHKYLFETVDRSLRKTRNIDKPFGGLTTLLSGDWKQTLPVCRRGGKPEVLNSILKKSKLWKSIQVFKLEQNMRLEKSTCPEEQEFHKWQIQVGEGTEKTYPEMGKDDLIKIPEKLRSKSANLKEFCSEIFPDLSTVIDHGMKNRHETPEWVDYLVERAILCPKNVNCKDVNRICMDMVGGQPMVYRSSDKMLNPTEAINFPTEFLNEVYASGMPDHLLVLKKGTPIMLLMNLDKENGHANGARYVVMDMTPKIIYALGISEENRGKILLIPRIRFHPKGELSFEMERIQFPVRSCFGMTSDKSQGQSLKIVGANLTEDFFAHGQLYVVISRVTSSKGLKIFKPSSSTYPHHMVNVVYKEVL